MALASYKLRFHDRHVRVVPARDADGCAFTGPGVDLRGAEADALFALAGAFHAHAAGVLRAVSVECATRRVLLTFERADATAGAGERPRVLRLDAPASEPLLRAAAALEAALVTACLAKLDARG